MILTANLVDNRQPLSQSDLMVMFVDVINTLNMISEGKSSQLMTELNEFLNSLKQVDLNLSIQNIPEKVLLLLGDTKAGKTTLLYYLLRKKLVWEYNQHLQIHQMKPEAVYFNAEIGSNYDSMTVYPNIPTEVGDDNVLIIDMPGFNDTRPFYRLLNIYIMRQTIRKLKSVHISIVIPYESLEGETLMASLQKSCLLLKQQFLQKQNCLSLILTKIEKQQDIQNFHSQLADLSYYYNQQTEGKDQIDKHKMKIALSNLQKAHIYHFNNQEPILEQGDALRKKIIEENKFHPIDETPENLLSSKYFETIAGQENTAEYVSTVVGIIRLIESSLPPLIEYVLLLVKYQYKDILVNCLKEQFDIGFITNSLVNQLEQLEIGELSSMRFKVDEKVSLDKEQLHVGLVQKFYFRQEKVLSFFETNMSKISNAAQGLTTETSLIDKQLLERVRFTFRYILLMLQTIEEISIYEIQQELHKCIGSEPIVEAFLHFSEFAVQNDLITKIVESAQGKQIAIKNQQFRDLLLKENPQLSFGEGREVIEAISTYGEIKNKKLIASMQQTRKSSQKTALKPKIREYHNESALLAQNILNSVRQIQELTYTAHHLKLLLQKVFSMKHVRQSKAFSQKDRDILKYLFLRTIEILHKFSLYEEAMVFSLALPLENFAYTLVDNGISADALSEEFIRSILIPYFSQISPNFTIISQLFDSLFLVAKNRQELVAIEKAHMDTLHKMHENLQKPNETKRIARCRFDYSMLTFLLSEQGQKYLFDSALKLQIQIQSSEMGKLQHYTEKLKLAR